MSRGYFSAKIVDGALWLNLLGVLVGVSSFLQLTISAKILGPKEISLISIFFLVQGILETVSETGLKKAAIQKENIVKEHLDTVFTVSLIKGVVLFLLVNIFQKDILLFFNFVEAGVYFGALSIVFLLQGLRNPFVIFFQRELNFKRHVIWQGVASIIKFLTVISLVFIFENVWSIVVGVLAYELSLLILSYTLNNVRPSFKFSRTKFLELFSYGRWVFLSTLVMLIDRQGAQFITTKLLRPEYLAFLYVSLQMSKAPQIIISQLKNTLFPVFSKLNNSNKKQEIERYFKVSSQAVLLLIAPLLAFVYVLESEIIKFFLGSDWLEINNLLFLILLSTSIESWNSISIATFNAIGRPNIVFYINTIRSLLLLFLSVFFISQYGLVGAGYAFVAKSIIASIFTRYFLLHKAKLRIDYICIFKYLLFNLVFTNAIFMAFYTLSEEIRNSGLLLNSFLYMSCFVCSWILLDKAPISWQGTLTYKDLMCIILRNISKKH